MEVSMAYNRPDWPYPHTHNYEDLEHLPKINGYVIKNGPHNEGKFDYDYDLQHKLDIDQMNAVNSGMTSMKVIDYDNLQLTKQDKLDDSEIQVLQSGINAAWVDNVINKLNEYEARITALEQAQGGE